MGLKTQTERMVADVVGHMTKENVNHVKSSHLKAYTDSHPRSIHTYIEVANYIVNLSLSN